jgi:hypothetical protein
LDLPFRVLRLRIRAARMIIDRRLQAPSNHIFGHHHYGGHGNDPRALLVLVVRFS